MTHMKTNKLKIGDSYHYSKMDPSNVVSWMDMFTIGSSGSRTIKTEADLEFAEVVRSHFLSFKTF